MIRHDEKAGAPCLGVEIGGSKLQIFAGYRTGRILV